MRAVPVLYTIAALAACGGHVEPEPSSGTDTTAPTANEGSDARSNGTRSPVRTDTGWATSAQGCEDFKVVVTHASKHQLLVLQSSRARLGLSAVGDSTTISLGTTNAKADVQIEVYKGIAYDAHCTALGGGTPMATLFPQSGTATITLSRFENDHDFDVSVSFDEVSLTSSNGLAATVNAVFTGVQVGTRVIKERE